MRCWRDFEKSGVTVALHGGGTRGNSRVAAEEFNDATLVAAFTQVVEDTVARSVGDPQKAGFGFAVP